MLTVCGLGNPGDGYRNTRHNAGFMTLDRIPGHPVFADCDFASSQGAGKGRRRGVSRFTATGGLYRSLKGRAGRNEFVLVKPDTFMNESGRALTSLRTRGILREPNDLLVVVDDVDLPIGTLRLRRRGSAAGHNGMKSIIGQLGTNDFARLRIGVGPRPDGSEMVDHVLGSFTPDELPGLHRSLDMAVEVVHAWLFGGYDEANNVHARLMQPPNTQPEDV